MPETLQSRLVSVFTRASDAQETGWPLTRQAAGSTQFVGNPEEYLAGAAHDVGRPVGRGRWEVFATGAADEALKAQIDLHAPEYIALHDVGTPASRRLLHGLAAAANVPVQTLELRRHGHGTALASICFVQLQASPGEPVLRLYSTDCVVTDARQRERLARVLLSHSRLGVVMVGELAPHALRSALRPLHDAVIAGPWHNTQLLMLPLGAPATLAGEATQFALGTGVTVRVTPQAARPSEAWNYITGAWNRMRSQQPASAQGQRATLPPNAADVAAGRYARECAQMQGVVSVCLFELATQRTLGHAGQRPGPAALAQQGQALLGAMAAAGMALALPMAPGHAAVPEARISLAQHELLLRLLPGRPGCALHVVVDKSCNLTMLRLQFHRLDAMLSEP